ncbi:MAG: nicotinamide mononucleotide transporter [Saprospiraceae bacterium]|jgi:nicotinamide mononucleotide transporter
MAYIEWGATIFSLIYLYYAIKNKPICFIYGIVGSSIWAFVSYGGHYIFDTALQVFYIIMSIIGIYRWKYGGTDSSELPITEYPFTSHLLTISAGSTVAYLLYWSSQFIEIIDQPLLDAFTTVFLIIGTVMLIERKLSSWIYLVIADIGCIYMYSIKGWWLFVGMMVIYIVFGVAGYLAWRKQKDLVVGC